MSSSSSWPKSIRCGGIDPDGRAIIFAGRDAAGRQGLWLQPLDEIVARFLSGTERASYPFWSPDSERVGFFADGKLKRVTLDGGRVEVRKFMPWHEFSRLMAQAQFLFVPNVHDASPRVVTEALARGTMLVVNRNILCGAKYVVPETGELFTDEGDVGAAVGARGA